MKSKKFARMAALRHPRSPDLTASDLVKAYKDAMKDWPIFPSTVLAVGTRDPAFDKAFSKLLFPTACFRATSPDLRLNTLKIKASAATNLMPADVVLALNPMPSSEELTDVINCTRKYLLIICIDFEQPFPEVFNSKLNDLLTMKLIAKHVNVA